MSNTTTTSNNTLSNNYKIVMPLQMEWQPKEDITVYELALCMPYLIRHHEVMPYEVDINAKHIRHFKITDHNSNM